MKLNTIIIAGLLAVSTTTSADTLYGIYVEAGVSQSEFSGTTFYKSADNGFSFDDAKNTNPFASIKIEHPIPLIPNIRVSYESFDMDVHGSSTGFEFDDISYGTEFDSAFNGQEMTGTLYYEFLDNVVSLDAGLSVKNTDMTVGFSGEGLESSSQDLNIWILTVYVAAEAMIPGTGIIVGAEVEALAFDGNEFTVANAYVGYELVDLFAVDAALKFGLKKRDVKLDDVDGFTMDLSNDSVYGSIQIHF